LIGGIMLRVIIASGLTGCLWHVVGQTQPAVLYEQAMTDYANAGIELAASEFTEFVHDFPDDPNCATAHLHLGNIHASQRRYDQAVMDFAAVVDRYPNSPEAPEAHFMKGVALNSSGRKDAAVEAWRVLLLKYPTSYAAIQAQEQLLGMETSK
jgi:TolA-binding protein